MKRKNCFVILLFCLLIVAFSTVSFGALFGDVDLNGKVQASDARRILRHAAKLELIADAQALPLADVDGNGKIAAADARLALRMASKMDPLVEVASEEATTAALTAAAPTTEAPTTEAPTTEAPTTEAPTTEAPTTEAPTTEAPTTEVIYGDWTPADENEHRRVSIYDSSVVETAAHTWNKGKVTAKATCDADGEKTFTCTVCGAVKIEKIPAIGHKYGEWTAIDENEHQRVCANDASHVETAAHDWDNGKVITAAAAGKEGEKQYTCKSCGAVKTEVIEALPVLPDTAGINAYVNARQKKIVFTFWMNDKEGQPVTREFDMDLTIRCKDSVKTEMYSVSKKVSAEEILKQYDPYGVERVCYILEIPFDELSQGFKPYASLECKMKIGYWNYFEWKDSNAIALSGLPFIVNPESAGKNGYFDADNEKLVIFVWFVDDEGKSVATDADLSVRIVNDDGTEMYNKTIAIYAKDFKTQDTAKPIKPTGNPELDKLFREHNENKKYCARVEIPYADLSLGAETTSTIYMSVKSHTGERETAEVVWNPEITTQFPTK